MSQRRCWCFTWNNYDETSIEYILNIKHTYVVIGKEVGEMGTPHLQGYIEFINGVRFNTIKKMLPECHLEGRKGSSAQAITYCKKDDDFIEDGKIKKQGERNDLDRCRELASHEGMRVVTRVCNFQEIKVAEKFLTYNETPRSWKPYVYWIYGPTGSGKSQTARELCSDDVYCKASGNKWWDGYDGHECVILDDFRESWFEFTTVLALLDRYGYLIETKGGGRQFKPRLIVITSQHSPKYCFPNNQREDINQLVRRIDCVAEYVTNVTEVGGNTKRSDFKLIN